MPVARSMGSFCRHLLTCAMSLARPPRAVQSRWASSISLSEADSQSALRVPCSQRSRMMPVTWRPFPQPVPSPSIQPRRSAVGLLHVMFASEAESRRAMSVACGPSGPR